MNGKKIFYLFLIVFILVVAAIGYFLFPLEEKTEEGAPEIVQPDASEDEECGMLTNIIIDGVFQRVEDNYLYLQPRDEDLTGVIKLTEETRFSEMTLSGTSVVGEEEINLADFKEGNHISVVALYDTIKPEKKTALAVRRMITK